LRKPKILLLDEVTSALDIATEERIMDSLYQGAKDCGWLMVAHRLGTIREVDRIVVLQAIHGHGNDSIQEQGTFPELISHQGWFRMIWDKHQQVQSKMTPREK